MNKSIEIFSLKGCEPCDQAIKELLPIAKDKKIPLTILPLKGFDLAPTVCVVSVDTDKKVIRRKCIEGYYEGISEDILKMIGE